MVDIYHYSLTPKYEHIVKAITKYRHYYNDPPFNLVRNFRTVEIELHTYKPLEETVIEIDTVLGESILTTLNNKYHCYCLTNLKGYIEIDFSCDMPDDVREKLKEDPNCDLEELEWNNYYGYYNIGSDSESEDPEEKFYDDVWVHTPFSITFIRHEPPTPPRIPSPPPKFSYEYAPIEEMSLDDIFNNSFQYNPGSLPLGCEAPLEPPK